MHIYCQTHLGWIFSHNLLLVEERFFLWSILMLPSSLFPLLNAEMSGISHLVCRKGGFGISYAQQDNVKHAQENSRFVATRSVIFLFSVTFADQETRILCVAFSLGWGSNSFIYNFCYYILVWEHLRFKYSNNILW